MNKRTILLTGGGSGGHAMPLIAIYEALNKFANEKNLDFNYLWVGSKYHIEGKLASELDLPFAPISTGKLRRYFSFRNFIDLFKVFFGFIQSLFLIMRHKPAVVFSTGGFVSVPVVVAASFLRTHIIIHEQTIDAGLANKIAARFAHTVAVTFEESKRYFPSKKVMLTGIPLRSSIRVEHPELSHEQLGLSKDLPTIYITGGGLGCHILNETILELLPELLVEYQVVFQTGNALGGEDYRQVCEFKQKLANVKQQERLQIYNFVTNELADIYQVADLVIARSGAGTVNELIALKKPAIFVPLAIATNNEQLKNAHIMADVGAAIIIEETQLIKK